MKKFICILMTLSLLLCCTGCISYNNHTSDLEEYSDYLGKVHLSEQHMPTLEEVGEYSDIEITYNFDFVLMFETNTVGLFLSYDEAEYAVQKNRISSNYEFFSPDDEDLESDCDASVNGYDINLVRADYEYDTYKTGLLIGTDDENCRICYLFYLDTDLDVLDDLDSYIEEHFYIP